MTGQSVGGRDFRTCLAEAPLVCDGAMGTMLHAVGASLDRCLPELNLSRPELVRDIHRGYLEAGAEILETNTFGANALTMARFGLGDEVELVNEAAVRLAREARSASDTPAFIAGSIGPAPSPGVPSASERRWAVEALSAQAEALERAGVDLFVLETFGDLALLADLVAELRQRSALALVAQMTFTEEGTTLSGESPEEVAKRLVSAGADVIGANCTLGPRGIIPILEALVASSALPISVQPNAGPPRRVRGRIEYRPNEDYFARAAASLITRGARIVGGCCGTTPRHIEVVVRHLHGAIADAEDEEQPAPRRTPPARPSRIMPESLAVKMLAGEFVVSAEVAAPDGAHAKSAIDEAAGLLAAGASTILVAPAAHSPGSMGSVSFGLLLKERLGAEPVVSVATFDSSILGLEADLLGAHALGVRAVLCTTGDPQPRGDYPEVAQLFDVSATGLIEALTALNGARSAAGSGLRATSFLVGARIDPGAADFEAEVERIRGDLAAGAQFLVTTPIFELGVLEALLDALGRPQVPVLLGIAPLADYRQAEFLHFERPTVNIAESVLERLRRAGDGAAVGREMARELVASAAGLIAGVVIYRTPGVDIAELVSELRATAAQRPLAPT